MGLQQRLLQSAYQVAENRDAATSEHRRAHPYETAVPRQALWRRILFQSASEQPRISSHAMCQGEQSPVRWNSLTMQRPQSQSSLSESGRGQASSAHCHPSRCNQQFASSYISVSSNKQRFFSLIPWALGAVWDATHGVPRGRITMPHLRNSALATFGEAHCHG